MGRATVVPTGAWIHGGRQHEARGVRQADGGP
jgi:hypothetical protein